MIAFAIFFGISAFALALAVTTLLSQRTALQEKLAHHVRVIRELYPLAYGGSQESDDWKLEMAREIVEESMEEELVQEVE